jgi:hypothetical protein
MDGHVRRPGPDLPAGWLSQFSIVRLSGPSITTYTSDRKDPENNSTIYEMGSNLFLFFLQPDTTKYNTGFRDATGMAHQFVEANEANVRFLKSQLQRAK